MCLLIVGFLSPAEAARATKPAITSSLTTTGTVSVAFDYQITASHSPTSYGATNLPSGLSLDTSTGEITGSPQASGTTKATISASNANGSGSATLTIKITASTIPVITSLLTASGTTGTAFSYQITASNSPTKYAATPLPAGLSISTTTGAITGTPTTAATTSVTISATNSHGTGTATLAITIGSSGATGTGTVTAPAQAVAAGFSKLVFDDEFTSASTVASSTSPTSGFNWYWNTWYGTTKDYTVTTGAGSGATAGATGFLTINGPMELQSVPSDPPASQRVGTWQHAYFEARIQYSYTVTGSGGPDTGWPSFWTFAIQAQSATVGQQIAELDFLEAYPLGTAGATAYVINTLHNWQATKSNATGIETANTNDNNYQQSLQGTTESAQPTDNGWHTYGCLWTGNGTSGTVQFYYDNHLILHQGSVTTFPVGTGTSFPALEQDNMYLILQGVQGWPINVDWVRVWQ